MRQASPAALRLSAWAYAHLLRAYPASFRAEFGGEMALLFSDCCRDEWRSAGPAGVCRLLARVALDTLVSAPPLWAERLEETMKGHSADRRWGFWLADHGLAMGGLALLAVGAATSWWAMSLGWAAVAIAFFAWVAETEGLALPRPGRVAIRACGCGESPLAFTVRRRDKELLFDREHVGPWRRLEHLKRDGNLYPTHGLGPVAWYLDIHRGDRFERLVSMSSPSLGLQGHRDRTLADDDPRRQETYACGDMNTSLLRTARGRTVVLQHDVVSPRPYSRINMVSGTKGTFADYPARVFLDGQEEHAWRELRQKDGRVPGGIEDRFEDPLWKRLAGPAEQGGHGGMDYVMNWRLVECLREGLPPDMDVYDAAAWSAPAALSEQSVAGGNVPVEFPDFTRGRWKGTPTSL